MIKDITLGQYFPGNSFIHRLDPRIKLIALVVFIVSIFFAEGLVSYGLCIGFTVAMVAISKIKPKLILRSLRAIIIIVIFTALLNMLYTPGKEIVSFWI